MSAAEHEAAIGRLLAELGDTADKVADTLRAKGIKGKQVDVCHCPIANYVTAAEFEYVNAAPDWITAEGAGEGFMVKVDTPPSVRDFIERFDDGVYLDLVEVGR